MSSDGEGTGDGDGTSICATNGALWGNGDMSIMSIWASMCAGDDDSGNGGVVTYSACVVNSPAQRFTLWLVPRRGRQPPVESIIAAVVNSARRGVGNMGLLKRCRPLLVTYSTMAFGGRGTS
jgi:hypothetical protein